jgi:hypothetical protein
MEFKYFPKEKYFYHMEIFLLLVNQCFFNMTLSFFKNFLITFLLITLFITPIEIIARQQITVSLILYLIFFLFLLFSFGYSRFCFLYGKEYRFDPTKQKASTQTIEVSSFTTRIKKNKNVLLLELGILFFFGGVIIFIVI